MRESRCPARGHAECFFKLCLFHMLGPNEGGVWRALAAPRGFSSVGAKTPCTDLGRYRGRPNLALRVSGGPVTGRGGRRMAEGGLWRSINAAGARGPSRSGAPKTQGVFWGTPVAFTCMGVCALSLWVKLPLPPGVSPLAKTLVRALATPRPIWRWGSGGRRVPHT